MPYVGPATGQVIPRRNRAGTKSSIASSSSSTTASLPPSSVTSPVKAELALPTDAAATDDADLLTPRPTSIAPTATIDTLSANLAAAANISDKPDRTSTEEKEKGVDSDGSEVRTAVKEAGLAPSESSASLTSMSTQSEIGTPPTSSTTPDLMADVEATGLGEDAEDGVASRVNRYREGLYAYTRNLYLEAKLSQSQKEGKAAYAQFGLKQSGMERLAAKKALARRLNA